MNKQYSIKHVHFKLMIPSILLLIAIVPFLTSGDMIAQASVIINILSIIHLIMQYIAHGYKKRQIIYTYNKHELLRIVLYTFLIYVILFAKNLLLTTIIAFCILLIVFSPMINSYIPLLICIPIILFSLYKLYQIDGMVFEKYNHVITKNKKDDGA